jgi:hypothetical protein
MYSSAVAPACWSVEMSAPAAVLETIWMEPVAISLS